MIEDDLLYPAPQEDTWLTVEQVALAIGAEPQWLLARLEAGLIPQAELFAGAWRCEASALLRARRMREAERAFDAAPELAALVADLLEELDRLRPQLRR
jgi:chaperone modulatory protein CbpM